MSYRSYLVAFFLLSFPLMSQGALLTTSGVWQNVTPQSGSSIISGVGTSTLSWGSGTPSSFSFTGVGGATLSLPGSPGGTTSAGAGIFEHANNPNGAGTGILGADLILDLVISNGGALADQFTFAFTLLETPNSAPCDPLSVSICDDEVTIATGTSQAFSFGGMDYVLDLAFSNGGSTLFTQEGAITRDSLQVKVTNVNNVPEPTTLSLFGVTLLAAFAIRRRRKI